LRKALADDGNGNKFIETVPKRGYRFVAEVRVLTEENSSSGNGLGTRRDAALPVEHSVEEPNTAPIGAEPRGPSERTLNRLVRRAAYTGLAVVVAGVLVIGAGAFFSAI
jgi:hypothetical protein